MTILGGVRDRVLGSAPYLLGLLLLVTPILLRLHLPQPTRLLILSLPAIVALVMVVRTVIQGTAEDKAKVEDVAQERTEVRAKVTEETTDETSSGSSNDEVVPK